MSAPGRDGQREVADGRASPSRGVVNQAGPGVADSVDARGVDDMAEVARLAAGVTASPPASACTSTR